MIFYAIHLRNKDGIRHSLEVGANIDAREEEHDPILIRKVSQSPSVAEVEELLGIEPDVRNKSGESAVDLAISLGLVNVIERLKSLPAG